MSDQPETSRIIERRDESGQVESTTSDADENPVLNLNVTAKDQRQFVATVTNVTQHVTQNVTQNVTNVFQSQTAERPLHEPSSVEGTTRRATGTEPSTNSIEMICSQLKEVSRKQASELSGTGESILDDRNVRIAPLELVKQTQDSDLEELGRFHHRKDVAKMFNKPPTRDIHYPQLFNEAKAQAASDSEKWCSTLEAKQKFQLIHGNIVGIVGQAGIGKTTLTKLIAREILESNLYEADFVFYLHFRNINYQKEMNLIQFLTNDSTFSNNLAEEDRKQLLTKLEENENVCLILDGFDESTISDKSKPVRGNCSIFDTVRAETIIKHLLNGDILPKAKKLITSRPRQLFQLHKTYRPHFLVSVLGLNESSQRQVCEDVCENNDVCTEVFKFINDRPDLNSFCYVPVNCVLVMYCISVNFDAEDLSSLERLDSLTTILVATLTLFAENTDHLRGEELRTKKLSLLAFTTFVLNQLVFEQKDLVDCAISDDEAGTFLTTRLGKKANLKLMKGRAKMKSYFSHLLLHEFFAALYLILFMDLDEFEETRPDLKNSKFEMVAKFAFGLCNSTTQQYLMEIIPLEEFNLADVERKKELLKELALEQVHSVEEFTDLPQICSWLYELREDELSEEVVSNLKNEFKVELDNGLLPSDTPAYHYVLQMRNTPLFLFVQFRRLYVRSHWEQFASVFDGLIQSEKVQIKEFTVELGGEEFKDDDARQVASYIHGMEVLRLRSCNMTSLGIRALSSAVAEKDKQVRVLDLGRNKLGNEGAMHLAKCIKNVEELLILNGCNIGTRGMEALSEEIMRREQPIQVLDLGRNKFGDDGAMRLAKCILKVEELRLDDCNIGARGMELLSSGIMQRDHPIRKLDLYYNKFGDDGAMHLAKCICNLDEVIMYHCNIGARGVKFLSEEIQRRNQPIRVLDLGWNKLGDNGAMHLAKCINKIRELRLYHCNIAARGVETLSEEIMQLEEPLTELNVSGNKLGDEGAENFKFCLHNIKELNVRVCGISPDVARSLENYSAGCKV